MSTSSWVKKRFPLRTSSLTKLTFDVAFFGLAIIVFALIVVTPTYADAAPSLTLTGGCPPPSAEIDEVVGLSVTATWTGAGQTDIWIRVITDNVVRDNIYFTISGTGSRTFTGSFVRNEKGTYAIWFEWFYKAPDGSWVFGGKTKPCRVTVVAREPVRHLLTVRGGINSRGEGWYPHGETVEVSSDYSKDLDFGRSRLNLIWWSLDGKRTDIERKESGVFATQILMDKPHIVEFGTVVQHKVRVYTVDVDEGGKQTPLLDKFFDEGSVVELDAEWFNAQTVAAGEERRPTIQAVSKLTVKEPIDLAIPRETYYELEGVTKFGTISGLGVYRKGLVAEWKVKPNVVSDAVFGFLGLVYRARVDQGKVLMDGPKSIVVDWVPDIFPLLTVIIPLITTIILPCYGWPPWKRRPPKIPTPGGGPSSKPTILGKIGSSHGVKVAGIWAPVGLYAFLSSISLMQGLPSLTVASLTVAGTLLGSITAFKFVSCKVSVPVPVAAGVEKCTVDGKWYPGPSIKVLKNISIFPTPTPSGKYLELDGLRPGDVIGISVLAEDLDIFVQECKCTQTFTKKLKPVHDRIRYGWELIGPGRLILPGGYEHSSILYQLPYCFKSEEDVDIRIEGYIHNYGDKADDATLEGSIDMRLTTGPWLVAPGTPSPGPVLASISINPFKEHPDQEVDESPIGDCTALPESWEPNGGIKGEAHIYQADLWPDNLILLRAEYSDSDNLIIRCTSESCVPPPDKVLEQPDTLEYIWTLKSGEGAFPLGDRGPAVVFQKGNKDAVIEVSVCDKATQAPDTCVKAELFVSKRLKPRALVGVGDISHWARGDMDLCLKAANLATRKYEAAGYEVDSDPNLTLGKLQAVFQNPRYQAIWLTGHGDYNEGRPHIVVRNDVFIPEHISAWSKAQWGCKRHPFIREFILHACDVGRYDWSQHFFALGNYYAWGRITWDVTVYSEVLQWEKNKHKPVQPHPPSR